MNQTASPAPDPPGPPSLMPAPLGGAEDVAEAVRLPGVLGRRRDRLPIAPAAPPVPGALSTFNRLTAGLDHPVDRSQGGDRDVVTELSGRPVVPVRARAQDGRA